MFDKYSSYSYLADQAVASSEGKIYDDIAEIKKITEYHDLLDYISMNFGNIDNMKDNMIQKDYANNMQLYIKKIENGIAIVAVDNKNKKFLLSRTWQFTPCEE